MDNKFSDQVGGFISLRLYGDHLEQVINMALSRGIYIWDIKRGEDCIYLKVRNSGYEAFKTIANDHNFVIEVVKNQGLPFYKMIMKRRMGLLAGAVLFILTLYIMSSFVWFIKVSGNDKVERNRILLTAARYGIHAGAGKWSFSRTEAEQGILRDISEIAYVECNVRGVKVDIKVVEKILPDRDINDPCNIVASRDGVIEEVLVLNGSARVKAGDVVTSGDILISGIVYPPVLPDTEGIAAPAQDTEPSQVRARGIVKARTWYEGYGECSRKTEEKVFTGQEFVKVYLKSPRKSILLKGRGENPFSIFETNEKLWKSPVGNWGISILTYQEQIIKTTEYSENEAVDIARKKALQNLQQIIPGGLQISDSHTSVLSSPSDSIIRIRISAEAIEDIGLAQPLNGDEISH